MTDGPRYPTITDAMLVPFRTLQVQIGAHPDLLNRPECPYQGQVLIFLRQLLGSAPQEVVDYDDDDLVSETVALYRQVKLAGETTSGVDPKEKMAILKTAADLLTKLISLREKAVNAREMAVFQRDVLSCLDTIITPAQRSEFIEKLGQYL